MQSTEHKSIKILIIRFSSIGDIVLTSTAVQCIREQLPEAEIHYLTLERNAEAVRLIPNVDELHIFTSLADTLQELLALRFSFVADMQANRRSRKLCRKIGVTTSRLNKKDVARIVQVLFKRPIMNVGMVLHRYIDVLASLNVGFTPSSRQLITEFSSDDIPANQQLYEQSVLTKNFAVIVFGAQHATKQIPLRRVAYLCEQIGEPIVILGGKSEREQISQEKVTFGANVVNLCGQTTLRQSAYLLSLASVVIAADTGLMHIASALNRPLIAVWGNTTTQMGFAPSGAHCINYEVSGLRCRPCSRFGKRVCPCQHHRCMEDQPWHSIAQSAIQLMNNK